MTCGWVVAAGTLITPFAIAAGSTTDPHGVSRTNYCYTEGHDDRSQEEGAHCRLKLKRHAVGYKVCCGLKTFTHTQALSACRRASKLSLPVLRGL